MGVLMKLRMPGPEQHAHGADVVHQPRHQVAGLLLLVEAERQVLEVREEVVAQVVLDVAADVEDDDARDRPHDALHDRDADDQARASGASAASARPAAMPSTTRLHSHGTIMARLGRADQADDAGHARRSR